MPRVSVVDLAGVVYSSGKVFDGLATGRLDTESFLRSGDTAGVSSVNDLNLLNDLKAAAEFIIEHQDETIDETFLTRVNAQLTRSASIQPGQLRRGDQRIGVNTNHGRHEPPAVSADELHRLVVRALDSHEPAERAAGLFLTVAKAQPFMDGNKRTGLFAANALLLGLESGTLLTVPMDEDDPTVAAQFNDLLAGAYIFDQDPPVTQMLLEQGIVPLTFDS